MQGTKCHSIRRVPDIFYEIQELWRGLLLEVLLSVEKSHHNQKNIIQVKNCVNADKLCDFGLKSYKI